MTDGNLRVISFESIANFRDLGGYTTAGGRMVEWKRLYRSGDPMDMSAPDRAFLKDEVKLKTVIDLTTPTEQDKVRKIKLLEEIGVKYFNIPFRPDVPDYYKKELEEYKSMTNMGNFYLGRIRHETFGRKLIQALEVIADAKYHPILFHCGVGKDRTGVLAAALLNALAVSDDDIISDYVLTDDSMEQIRDRIVSNSATRDEVKNLPDFTWRAKPEYMQTFLDGLNQEYGGTSGYLKKFGADKTLLKRLKKILLV